MDGDTLDPGKAKCIKEAERLEEAFRADDRQVVKELLKVIDAIIKEMSGALIHARPEEVEVYVFAIRYLKKLRELLEKEC